MINAYGDANFLRTRLYTYVAAIQSYVLSQCPSAIFELLWPMDERLKRYLGQAAPPLLYGVGSQSLLNRGGLAVVGLLPYQFAG